MNKQNLSLLPNEFWSVGTITFSLPIRSIYGGYVEPLLRLPLVSTIPELVLHYLIAIPGERDYLDREHHEAVGWHYHYLDFRERRSNLLLSWDTRAQGEDHMHPFFEEPHGEGRAKFTARPDLWGERKRRSMHDACYPDLAKWNLRTFRCASAKASPVWPTDAVLTPIPRVTPPLPKRPAKKARKEGR